MSRKHFYITMGVILAVMAALLVWAFSAEAEKTWDVCYPMSNQHIEWTGAGYSGIYGR